MCWNFLHLCESLKGVPSSASDRCVKAWDNMKISRDFFKCHWVALPHRHTHSHTHIYIHTTFFSSEVLNNSAVLSRLGQLGPLGLGTGTSLFVCMCKCCMCARGLSLSRRQTAGVDVRILSSACYYTHTCTHIPTYHNSRGGRLKKNGRSTGTNECLDMLLCRQACEDVTQQL